MVLFTQGRDIFVQRQNVQCFACGGICVCLSLLCSYSFENRSFAVCRFRPWQQADDMIHSHRPVSETFLF